MKMHPSLIFVSLAAVLVTGATADGPPVKHGGISFNATPCVYPTETDEFAASFYSAMIVTIGHERLKSLKLNGVECALQEYAVDMELIGPGGLDLCNASPVSYTCSRSLALYDQVTIKAYVKSYAFATAEFLDYKGMLRCDNAVTLALRFYKETEKSLSVRKLDKDKFRSYQTALNDGLFNFLKWLKFDLAVIMQELADFYDDVYMAAKGDDGCPLTPNSSSA